MSDGQKEWVKVRRSAKGEVTVTVTVVEANLSAGWTVRAVGLRDRIKTGVLEARAGAQQALDEMRKAFDE